MLTKLQQLIRDGEGLTVEFKRCAKELPKSVYETVCSFSNRYGGYILLGVEDNGSVSGVKPEAVKQIEQDFTNSLNNPQKFAPTLFIRLEEAQIGSKTVLWCHIPPNSQVVRFDGKIYDRAADGDLDITPDTTMVTQMHQRRVAEYTERKIYPYAKESDFEFERLMPIVRRLAVTHHKDHPWEKMGDQEILKDAGLYQSDPELGVTGYNLAAVMLFGSKELIQACTPNYVTDSIFLCENLAGYDDSLLVRSNLLDAYDALCEFFEKHTLDRFFLIDALRVSVRSWIVRELVSNILVHRDFTSAYPAKIVITHNRIVTENWCRPKRPGRIDPERFTPYPKNPLIASFFINIGRADVLGSGVRNLYKYTKIYSGGEPELIEDDVFRTIVPLTLSDSVSSDKMSDNDVVSDKMSDKTSDNDVVSDKTSDNDVVSDKMSDKTSDNEVMSDKKSRDALLTHLRGKGEVTTAEVAKIIGRSVPTARRMLSRLVADGVVVALGANRNRKYKRNHSH